MTVPSLLAADIGEVIKFLIVAAFIIIAVLGQLIAKIKGLNPPQQQPGQPRPKPPGGGLQDQIEEFLRRAASPQRAEPRKQRKQPEFPEDVVLEADAAEMAEQPVGGRVTQQVREYMDTSDFSRRSQHLGEDVAKINDQFESRAESVFGGEMSALSKRSGTIADVVAAIEKQSAESRPTVPARAIPGQGLSELFGRPNSILNAIIVSEILKPRWEE